jgi:hypothetical protein
MLSNHLARLQCHPGQGQETSVHTLWFPCRFLLGKGYRSSQTRRVEPTRVHILDGTIPQEQSKGPGLATCFTSVVLLAICPRQIRRRSIHRKCPRLGRGVQRMDNLKMTRFRSMILHEQAMKIEQWAQEALKAREEVRVAEATEAQNRGLTMTPEAQARGMFLIE